MNKSVFLGTLAATSLFAGIAAAQTTLETVKARGELNCGVNTGLVGFAAPDANGNWQGFDVAVCKAVAAAVLLYELSRGRSGMAPAGGVRG